MIGIQQCTTVCCQLRFLCVSSIAKSIVSCLLILIILINVIFFSLQTVLNYACILNDWHSPLCLWISSIILFWFGELMTNTNNWGNEVFDCEINLLIFIPARDSYSLVKFISCLVFHGNIYVCHYSCFNLENFKKI